MYSTILTFIRFNNFGTWHLNGPRHLFHPFCCTTRRIFESLRVYEPGFSMDKYGMYICMYNLLCMYVCMYVRTYIRMYVLTYVCNCAYIHVCMYVRTYIHMYVLMNVCNYACIHVCMYRLYVPHT